MWILASNELRETKILGLRIDIKKTLPWALIRDHNGISSFNQHIKFRNFLWLYLLLFWILRGNLFVYNIKTRYRRISFRGFIISLLVHIS